MKIPIDYQSFIHNALASILLLGGISGCSDNKFAETSPWAQQETIKKMYQDYRGDFPGITETWPSDIAEAYAKGKLILVDVRTKKEQAVSMIPGAITKEEFEQDKNSLADKRIIVHCTIGYRSGVYVKKLADQGFHTENLAGSILLWAHERLPLEDSKGQPTKRIHVYGKKWNLLPEDYNGIW